MPDGHSVRDIQTPLRLQLWRNGYPPVPAYGKAVYLPDWPEAAERGGEAEYRRWRTTFEYESNGTTKTYRGDRHTNTGVLCGTRTAADADGQMWAASAVDIDVLERELAERITACADKHLGYSPLCRIGMDPKRLLVFRCAASLEKQAVRYKWADSDRVFGVEILGAGQQFIGYGIHPDTKREYAWVREGGPDVVPLIDLPEVTTESIGYFLAEVDEILRAAGAIACTQTGDLGPNKKAAKPEPMPPRPPRDVARDGGGTQYGLAALNGECEAIRNARFGSQEQTINAAALKIGGYVAGGELDEGAALQDLLAAVRCVQSEPGKRPWAPAELENKVRRAFADGKHTPRSAPPKAAPPPWKSPAPAHDQHQAAEPEEAPRGEPADPQEEPKQASQDEPRKRGKAKVQSDAPDPWPEPLDILTGQATGAPKLQPEHIPAALSAFVFDVAIRMGSDPAAPALMALGAAASVAHDTWRIQPKRYDHKWTEQPRVWAAIVGSPGIKKSPIINACIAPIQKLAANAVEQHWEAMKSFNRAEHAWKKADSDPDTKPIKPKLLRYLSESATVESISEALRAPNDPDGTQTAATGKILVYQDEMTEWLGSFDRYRSGGKGGSDRGAYLRLYNGGPHGVERISRGVFRVPNWSACFVGGIQPGPLLSAAKGADEDGLLQRFCFCVPEGQDLGIDCEPDSKAEARYTTVLHTLASLRPPLRDGTAQVVQLHPEAHCYRQEIEAIRVGLQAMPDVSPRLKSTLDKWSGLFARLLLIFHLIELADATAQGIPGPDPCVASAGTAERVASYMHQILLPHLLRADEAMTSTVQTGHGRWIAGFILKEGMSRVTTRDVVNAYGSLRSPEDRKTLDSVMASLVTVGWLQPEPTKNPTSPPHAWFVNPAIHTVFATKAIEEKEGRKRRQQEAAEFIIQAKKAAADARARRL